MLIDDLCDRLLPVAVSHHAVDVRIGLGYTGVQLENGRCGLAYTFRQEARGGCCAFRDAGSLTGKPASELATLSKSSDMITAAVGLATLNALTDPLLEDAVDALDLLTVGPKDEVGMVGHFGPLVEPLRQRCKALYIFERMPNPAAGVLPKKPRARFCLVARWPSLPRLLC